jgi:hypothetical protein
MKRKNRSIIVGMRFSPEEKKAFRALADRRGTDLSELVRQLLHRELQASKQQTAQEQVA